MPTLDQLQGLWVTTKVATVGRCWHDDRDAWIDRVDHKREGWIRTECRICGGFVGCRPVQCMNRSLPDGGQPSLTHSVASAFSLSCDRS